MAINKTSANKKSAEETRNKFVATSIDVLRVHEMTVPATKNYNTLIAFDMMVNGIKIYGCYYMAGAKDGKEWSMIKLPQTPGKDKDGNTHYYDVVWFPISKDFISKVEKLIEEKL